METNIEQYERIQNYLDGLMNKLEQVSFEQELNNNIELQESFELEKDLRGYINAKMNDFILEEHEELRIDSEEYAQVKNAVLEAKKKWKEEQFGKRGKVVKGNFNFTKILSIAAVVILVVLGCYLFLPTLQTLRADVADNSNIPPNYDSLKQKNLKQEIKIADQLNKRNDSTALVKNNTATKTSEKSGVSRTRTSPIEPTGTTKEQIDQLFAENTKELPIPKEADLPDDIKPIAKVPLEDLQNHGFLLSKGENTSVQQKKSRQIFEFYKGISFIKTETYDKAADQMQWVIDHAVDDEWKQKAQWFRALLYLKSGNKDEAIKIISHLITRSFYCNEAKKLFQKLK